MKSILLLCFGALLSLSTLQAQEYAVVTSVESIIPSGIGRSRMIMNKSNLNIDELTTDRTDGKHSDQSKVKRKDIKVDEFEETKLLNFYALTGINFQNIASNDAVISEKLNQMSDAGWELVFVTSGVESDSGETDGHGIFITRYIFKR